MLQALLAAHEANLEQAGDLQEAERMFLAFDDPDGALAMWHAHHRFAEAVDLVARVRPVMIPVRPSLLHSSVLLIMRFWKALHAGKLGRGC